MNELSEAVGGPLPDEVPSVWDRFSTAVTRYPDNIALVSTHQPAGLYGIPSVPLDDDKYGQEPYLRWTYRSLKNGVARLLAGLTKQGVRESMPIFTFLPNMAEYVLAMWAADRLGSSFVPINPRNLLNKEEVVHMIKTAMSANHSTSAVFFAGSTDVAHQIANLSLDFPVKMIIPTSEPSTTDWTTFLDVMTRDQRKDDFILDESHQSKSAVILFTSGTTAFPKGCSWLHPGFSKICSQRELSGGSSMPDPGDATVIVVPNNHAIGCVWVFLTLCYGAAVVYPGPAFAPHTMMDTMRRENCTHTALVPIMVHALLGVKATSGGKLKSLKNVFLGGSMVSPEVLRQCADELGSKGVENAFGMTEGAVLLAGSSVNWRDELVSGEDVSVGGVMHGQKVRICSPGTRNPVKRGESGELHHSAPTLVPGYIGKESDDFYIGDDGRRWFITGDQASMDSDGRIFIVGRYKEMIIRGGENISPAAIEAVLGHVPKLAALNVQVVGVTDPIAGEIPIAVVDGNNDAETVRELQKIILAEMGPMYVPVEVVSLEALGIAEYPKTMAGKIQKTKVTALVRKYRDTRDSAPTKGMHGVDELESMVKHIWSRVVGHEVDVNAPVSTFADSITVMKARDGITKETGRNISLADMVEADTLAGQLKLLQNQPRLGEGKRLNKRPLRTGPPGPEDIVHLASDPGVFEKTKEYVEKALSPHNLDWADVEDVLPAYDFAKTLAQTGIFDTWGFKFALLTNMDAVKVRTALESTLTMNRIMASFLLWDKQAFGSDIVLHVLIRHRKQLFDRCITNFGKVKTVAELKDLALRYPYSEHATVPGPLCHALIADIEETRGVGVIISVHHAVVDASYGQLFFEDFDKALGGAQLEEHIDYKPWADSYFALRTSFDAKTATAWHVGYLTGLERHRKALLPPRGARANGKAPAVVEAEDGFEYSFQAPALPAIRREHGHISAPILLKTVVALYNVHSTKHTHALFSNLEASRMRFPFVPKALSSLDGQDFEASDVAGPTIQTVTNLIEIKPDEPVLTLLKRMQDDQINLTKYAAAPLCDVMSSLGEEAGPMVLETLQSQCFNWVPGMGTTWTNPFENHERLNAVVRPDIGLVYNAGLGGDNAETVFLHLRGTAFERSQLRTIAEDLEKITRWLTAKAHWYSRVGDFSSCLGAVVGGTS